MIEETAPAAKAENELDTSNIPASVLKQGEDADRMLAELQPDSETPAGDIEGEPDPAAASAAATPGTDTSLTTPSEEGQPDLPTGQHLASPPAETVEGLTEQLRVSREQFRSLMGKYNVEVKSTMAENLRLRTRETELSTFVNALQSQVDGFNVKITDLETQIKAKDKADPDKFAQDKLDQLSDTDRQTLQDEGLNNPAILSIFHKMGLFGDQAVSPVTPQANPGEAPAANAPDKAQLQGNFWLNLDKYIVNPVTGLPDHEQINTTDPNWIPWLKNPSTNPKHGGQIRQKVLDQAQNSWNAFPIIDLFNDFKLELGLISPQGNAVPLSNQEAIQDYVPGPGDLSPQPPAAQQRPTGPDLNQHIEPGPGQGAQPMNPAAHQERTYTKSDITRFYADCSKNMKDGTLTAAQSAQIADMDLALVDGKGRILEG